MRFLINILLQGLLVYFTAYLLEGVTVGGYMDAVIVAIVLAIVNTFIKPIITFLTLPITILTLGLFLLFINGFIILSVDGLLDGFYVQNLLTAIIFSIILSVFNFLFINYSR